MIYWNGHSFVNTTCIHFKYDTMFIRFMPNSKSMNLEKYMAEICCAIYNVMWTLLSKIAFGLQIMHPKRFKCTWNRKWWVHAKLETTSKMLVRSTVLLLQLPCEWLWGLKLMSNQIISLIARSMGPTWSPSGADRTQVGPMLAPWTLLSGMVK